MILLRSLKFQFIVFFSAFIVTLILVTTMVGMQQLSRTIERTLAEQGIYIVEKAASLIDGDSFEALIFSMDNDDPFYEETRLKLLQIKDNSGCMYLYTMAPLGGNFRQDTWMFIIDGSAEPDDEESFSALGDMEDTSDYDDAFRRVLISGNTEPSRLVNQEGWGWLIAVYAPIKNSAGAIVGIVGCDFDGRYLHDSITSVRNQKAFIGIVAIILGLALLAFSLRMIFSRLRNISIILQELSRGEGDLTRKIKIDREDEIGELSFFFNLTLEKFNSAFALFSKNASMVSTAVNDLSASAKEITTTANEQSASVAEIVSTMENNKNLSGQVASKTIEVAGLASKTQDLSQHGADLHDANEDMMLDIRNQNAKIVDEISNLSDVLSRIDESVQLIDKIADQTKLIAFNAALEASSSGEAGLRFAVVASEIRRFADNVVESVVEIKERISELQSASGALISEAAIGSRVIDEGHKRMVEQKEAFKNIVDVSQDVAARSQQISSLSRQQELATDQIFTTLKEISAGVRQFVTATASTSTTADKLNTMSAGLKETLAKYRTTEAGETA